MGVPIKVSPRVSPRAPPGSPPRGSYWGEPNIPLGAPPGTSWGGPPGYPLGTTQCPRNPRRDTSVDTHGKTQKTPEQSTGGAVRGVCFGDPCGVISKSFWWVAEERPPKSNSSQPTAPEGNQWDVTWGVPWMFPGVVPCGVPGGLGCSLGGTASGTYRGGTWG